MNPEIVANTIMNQLGGRNRLQAMIGGKNFSYGENSDKCDYLIFGFTAKATDGINYLKITLEKNDTYTVVFAKLRGVKFTELDKAENVFVDNLREVIEKRTGLYLSL